MAPKKKKKGEHDLFDSIRKPTPPPGQKFGGEKAASKVHPAQRKIKHKRKVETED